MLVQYIFATCLHRHLLLTIFGMLNKNYHYQSQEQMTFSVILVEVRFCCGTVFVGKLEKSVPWALLRVKRCY